MDRRYRYMLSIVAGAIAGHLIAALAGGVIIPGVGFAQLATSIIAFIVALVSASALPTIHLRLPAIIEDIVALLWLALVWTNVNYYALGLGADWGLLLSVGAIFAAACLFVYRLAAEWGRSEHD
jgi:hypothetical protein